ncbi:MAG: deoxynucleoside kinase [Anaerolineae bacterium]|nr:deoxynucleoside kinase [Anaerolineae bacterium]MDW8100275.1 deoxynucleoside kinase [Anaerolineae bacterium]
MRRNLYIAIEGPIGVGKTTLARILGDALNAEVLLEVFEENPFLSSFYVDRERYAFQTQIFFLLSRYRQQSQRVPAALARGLLVSDYLFAKDRLFAHLNMHDDELAIYEQLYTALSERIIIPDLVVYLRASTDVLMQRIALRDRPYERTMPREYIEEVRQAYERFFSTYGEAPLLVMDTDCLDFVHNPRDRAEGIGRIRAALEEGTFQPPLPEMPASLPSGGPPILTEGRRRLGDFQRFHHVLDREKGFISDLYLNFICLVEEVGEVSRELKAIWLDEQARLAQVGNRRQAQGEALQAHLPRLREELADVLAFVLKIANSAGIDLEAAYVEKMGKNWQRSWQQPGLRTDSTV